MLPFLDTLLCRREDGSLGVTVYKTSLSGQCTRCPERVIRVCGSGNKLIVLPNTEVAVGYEDVTPGKHGLSK